MTTGKPSSKNPQLPCTWQPSEDCAGCELEADLMCRFDSSDLTSFLLNFLPIAITVVAGMIIGGYGLFLLPWFAFWIFFFFVWEARVLCSHCPFWAEPGRILHCHANYGVVKFWRYRPGPMSRSERVQFIAGALILIGFPFVFLLLGSQYLLACIALATVISAAFNLRKHVCTRCIHFSCPVNAVPKSIVDAYLRRNPSIREAWEASGYRLDE
jgi:hypothetical protein